MGTTETQTFIFRRCESIMKYPKVTEELCMRCAYGYPCEMWDEREVPEEGEECPNFIAKCETEIERDQRIMNGGATVADALSWFKAQAQVVSTPTSLATMLARKVIETLEQANKRTWHTLDEKANLSKSIIMYDPDGDFMSPPVRCPFSFDDLFVKAMNMKYGANYQMWAYMDDIKPIILR